MSQRHVVHYMSAKCGHLFYYLLVRIVLRYSPTNTVCHKVAEL